jgi:hypothetical protein
MIADMRGWSMWRNGWADAEDADGAESQTEVR